MDSSQVNTDIPVTPLGRAKEIILCEADSLRALAETLGDTFEIAVRAILKCPGRVVVSGVGKSGIIGRKIAATFLSTGTPAMFLHPTEGVHGDLGAILPDDVSILISNSGESSEILGLMPGIKAIGAKVIVITGRPESSLATMADMVLPCKVEREADPHNLIPTASTAAQLALGDALALVVMERRGLGKDDLAKRHPAGSIGKRLTLKVSDIMTLAPDDPRVKDCEAFREALFELTAKRLGAVSVVDGNERLKGIITDGDVKRLLERAEKEKQSIDSLMETGVGNIMIHDPKRITESTRAYDALRFMEQHQISQIPVVDSDGKVVGMLRLLDLVKAGL
ncbi:KpsF/GutQ family sugar-phosphate isomerase [bacterium]|nr:KpsF/GutQ family sugar-phosphate isomerase [bacterium]